ncbi:MAG: glutamine--fructose-6-phosphate transaminase (isomerizing) [Candidatus Aminicenantes bacterium]|nr:glutamine--fructose-6-phosphate transaminase (isomerizing) [Candidatus Aminicenantes bacterium]
MCGIIGYIGNKDTVSVLLDGLKKLEYRGYDSAGMAIVRGDRIIRKRVKGKITFLEKELKSSPIKGDYGVGHTRWATHGRPSEENAHPHQDCHGDIVVVHNGIIENYVSLKEKLANQGHTFKTETDTEVIPHLIEQHFKGNLEEAVRQAVREMEGAFAVAAVSAKDRGKIVVARQGPPAVIGIGRDEYFISSDINPLLSYTRDVVFLQDREIAVVRPDGVTFKTFSGRSVKKEIEHVAWNPVMIEKGGYKHFMLKEIFEQPQVIRDTFKGRMSLDTGSIYLDEMGIAENDIKRISRAVIIACGTSFHSGLVGKYFIETLARIPVDVEYASEYRYRDFIPDEKALYIFISQSGETADTLAALKAVKKKDLLTLALCNADSSSLTRESKGVLLTHAGPEIGVAATKTFSAQMSVLALFALYTAQIKGVLSREKSIAYIKELQRVPHKLEIILNAAEAVELLALDFLSYSHFLYLGRWVSYPIALEGALKLKEISYVHAEGYPGGEMKHGPIALIDEKMPTMVIAPKDRVFDKVLSNVFEVKARLGTVTAVAFRSDKEIAKSVDKVIRIPDIHELFSPFLTAVPMQLFAYYIAAARGADVDQPRNLAKSVTVE